MGIAYMNKLLYKNAPGAITQVRLSALKRMPHRRDKPSGIWIAVDVSILLYTFKGISMTLGLQGLLAQFMRLIVQGRRNGIVWVFVWDGRTPDIKSGETERRRHDKQTIMDEKIRVQAELEACTDPVRRIELQVYLDSLDRRTISVSTHERLAVRQLMQLTGSIVLIAKGEADPLMAALAYKDLVDFVMSPDTDMFPHACPYVLRPARPRLDDGASGPEPETKDFFFSDFELVNGYDVLTHLGLTLPQFVDLCILMKCDYFTPRILAGSGVVIEPDKTWPMKVYHAFMSTRPRTIEAVAKSYSMIRAGLLYSDCDRVAVEAARLQFGIDHRTHDLITKMKAPGEHIAEESASQLRSLWAGPRVKYTDDIFQDLCVLLVENVDAVCTPAALSRHWFEWSGGISPSHKRQSEDSTNSTPSLPATSGPDNVPLLILELLV